MNIKIYTDGGFRFKNGDIPAQGSYGWVILFDGEDRFIGGNGLVDWHKQTTQIAEMYAIYKALEFIIDNKLPTHKLDVTVISDSQYCVNTLNEWYKKWSKNGKIIPEGKVNVDLWSKIWDMKNQFKSFRMQWVRGHNGDKWNEYVDWLNQKALGRE